MYFSFKFIQLRHNIWILKKLYSLQPIRHDLNIYNNFSTSIYFESYHFILLWNFRLQQITVHLIKPLYSETCYVFCNISEKLQIKWGNIAFMNKKRYIRLILSLIVLYLQCIALSYKMRQAIFKQILSLSSLQENR